MLLNYVMICVSYMIYTHITRIYYVDMCVNRDGVRHCSKQVLRALVWEFHGSRRVPRFLKQTKARCIWDLARMAALARTLLALLLIVAHVHGQDCRDGRVDDAVALVMRAR